MRLVVFGAAGQVGNALVELARARGHAAVGLDRRAVDICDAERVARALARQAPEVAVNAAAYTAVDGAEDDPEAAFRANRDGVAVLAAACARRRLPLVHISTDYVFDGQKPGAYREGDRPGPLGVYGRSKLAGEQALREAWPAHVILRTAWVFSASGRNFVKTMRRLAADGRAELGVVDDQHGCPTAAADIAGAILQIAAKLDAGAPECWGTYHYCGRPRTTWYRFARAILADRPGLALRPIETAAYPTRATRPPNAVLDCRRIRRVFGIARPDWRASLKAVLAALAKAPAG